MHIPPGYAELHCLSNFSFLRGASYAEELVERAHALGYAALALTDECSVAGTVRAHRKAKELGIKLIIGAEFELSGGTKLVLLARNREGYGDLCELITRGRRRAKKGEYLLTPEDFTSLGDGCLAILIPRHDTDAVEIRRLSTAFAGRAWIAAELLQDENDAEKLARLRGLSMDADVPLVACGDVHMHVRGRRALQDTLTSIRLGVPLAQCGYALYANGERHLRAPARLAQIYPKELLEESLRIAARCTFTLDELRYEYPDEIIPAGETPASYLRKLTHIGMRRRWPQGMSAKVCEIIEKELALITELRYEAFFLTVHDIVAYARSQGILCQGRGSAANSAVCYCLGITEVDPARMDTLFERFLSKERNEPPDIDVDFEHDRREEIIQHIYQKYGRHRAALAATVICYRPRSAVRDSGKALGLDLEQVDRLAKSLAWWDGSRIPPERLRECGFDPENPLLKRVLHLTQAMVGFPRHLSQHVGGFVIARGPLARLVPIENAAMPERTVIQWDKDDLDALGLLKVDVLALGMLSAIRRGLELVNDYRGTRHTMATLPAEDPATYEMISRGDTVGVFQIESRAQMAMLPRLQPRGFYDLVIEVAIVRPGPIQGNMVHPYLQRRQNPELVDYPHPDAKEILERTLGIPIFQEQVIKLAMVAAGFSAGEADALRRAMAAWQRRGGLEPFERRLIDGMRAKGYPEEFARRLFEQIKGFGEYGFPESHAASFALLVYVSSWLKCHEPAAFTCALLNSQPMGFYAPAQLVQDARRHGVAVRAADVQHSDVDCTLERGDDGEPALRLGLRMIKGLSREGAQRTICARRPCVYADMHDFARRSQLSRKDMEALAAAGALRSLAGHRRLALWEVQGAQRETELLQHAAIVESAPALAPPSEGENIVMDYAHLGLSLERHPLALLRKRLVRRRLRSSQELEALPSGSRVRTAGMVINRQRPGTATGVVFLTLEDEFGVINVVVWNDLAEAQRPLVIGARLLGVTGTLEKSQGVTHLIAGKLEDHTHLLGRLMTTSRDFH